MSYYYKELTIRRLNDLLLGVTEFEKLIKQFEGSDPYEWIEYLADNTFRTRIRVCGQLVKLGVYPESEEAAAVVRRELAILVRELKKRARKEARRLARHKAKSPKDISIAQIEAALRPYMSFRAMLAKHRGDWTRSDSSTGTRGVRRDWVTGRFHTSITVGGKNFYLGVYGQRVDAEAIVKRTRKKVINVLQRKAQAAGEI